MQSKTLKYALPWPPRFSLIFSVENAANNKNNLALITYWVQIYILHTYRHNYIDTCACENQRVYTQIHFCHRFVDKLFILFTKLTTDATQIYFIFICGKRFPFTNFSSLSCWKCSNVRLGAPSRESPNVILSNKCQSTANKWRWKWQSGMKVTPYHGRGASEICGMKNLSNFL